MEEEMEDIEYGLAEQTESEWLTNVYFPSKLGGKPAWLHLDALPTSENLKCSKCKNQRIFLCQIYAPFDDEYNFHRMIYVFICRTQSCYIANNNGNILILRSQLPLRNQFFPDVPPSEDGDAVPQILPKKSKLCMACGCIGSSRCSRCKQAYYCGVQHQQLHWPYHKLSCCTNASVTIEAKQHIIPNILLPEFEIDMNFVEGDNKRSETKIDIKERQEFKKFEQMTAAGKAGSLQNLPESELEKYVQGYEGIKDKYFHKFRKECEKCPFQIIRYKRGGEVLWIADPENTVKQQVRNIRKCELCGEDRVFEFQIMPQMLNYLKDSNLDWGLIAVYTCPKSCPLPKDKGYVPEFSIKQDIVNNLA